jgi:hypothetical protein
VSRFKLGVIVLALLCLVGLIGSIYVYQLEENANGSVSDRFAEGYASGLDTGDSQGYSRGLTDGTNQGYTQGYGAGYTNGTLNAPKPTQAPDRYDEGYSDGVSTGKTQGYNDGYNKGTADGLSNGYSIGYLNGTKDGAGSGYNIRDPTYSEMQSFITTDKTDENTYNVTYECHEFTRDVLKNAFNQGLKAGYVYIEFAEGAHALVCFDTVDKGLIFVEPQTDELVVVAVGNNYWGYVIVQFDVIW